MSTTEPRIRRFTLAQRLLHAVLAITFLGMLWTGLCLWSPTFAEIMNRSVARPWHEGFAVALGVAFVLVLVLRPRDLGAFAREVDSLDRDDIAWLRGGPRRLVDHTDAPEQGWLNAGQKLNTALTMGLMVVLTFTGVLLWLAPGVPALRFAGTVDVHDVASVLIVVLVCGHLYLAVIHPATRRSLPGMVTGDVDRAWARTHHARWVREHE
jgi:formate dehydrogenase subunit gamma